MKKLTLILAAAALAVSAQAQVRTSRTFIKQKSHSKTEWIVRAGLSINNMAGFKDFTYDRGFEIAGHKMVEDFNYGPCAGYSFDVAFNKYIGKTNLYWGMELGLGTRGFSLTEKVDDYDDSDTWFTDEEKGSYTGYNVRYSPIIIGYKFPIGEMLKIDPHIGAFVSYDFAGKISGDGVDGDDSKEFRDEYVDNDIDAGINVGVGVWYGRINLDFTYQRGFIDAIVAPFTKEGSRKMGKSSNFMIRVGYAF